MKASAAIGIVLACVMLLGGAVMEGTSPAAFIAIPAILIVFGGTIGATLAGTSIDVMKKIPSLYIIAFKGETPDLQGRVRELVGFAEKARRDGLLALDEQTGQIQDDFTRKGLQLVVDGTDPDLVAEILEGENENMRKRHAENAGIFDKAGGLGPTMGVIGTVMSLVHVLENLDDPSSLGHSISGAFIATLFGVGSANVVYMPVATRLKGLSAQEQHFRAMTIEGILGIQSGDNPRVIADKLMTYVAPGDRPSEDDAAGASTGGQAKAAA